MKSRARSFLVFCLPLALAASGCVSFDLAGRATDEWTHTYPLQPGGVVRIVNSNGRIEIEGVDGSTVEVHAERIAMAATDAAARQLLPRIRITEDARPDRVSIETERMSGIMIGAGVEVRYRVRAPKNVVVEVTNSNGVVTLTGLSGGVTARTTNGGVTGRALSGGVDARTTNGGVNVEMASVGSDKIFLSTTNGGVTLALPRAAKVDLTATCTNGGISATGLDLQVSEQSRRRLEARMNGGGTAVELRTTNGGIRVRPRDGAAESSSPER